MTVKITQTDVVEPAGVSNNFLISSLMNVSVASNPAYLVVNALDRLEYTAKSSGATGHFSGNGASLGLSSIGGDGRGAGIVYTWQASSGQYVNAVYGNLSQLTYSLSTSVNDVTNISFFGASSALVAQAYASNAYSLMQGDASGYLGSTTFVTSTTAASTAQATPDGVAAAALKMIGQSWNDDGCWVLASTIAAEAGAGLPVQSTALHVAGVTNGEWVAIYNGPAGSAGNWQSLVSTGDMVEFATSGSSGHITTCVSGTGGTAMLVDNIEYVGAFGRITNAANDGSASDVIIAAPHSAASEFAGVASSGVVIYALDTPAIADRLATASLAANATISLASLFSATDPGHKAITSYQVYETNTADTLLLNGRAVVATNAATAIAATSLNALSLLAGGSANADTLEIRASNGSYWGDWQSLTVNVTGPAAKPAVVAAAGASGAAGVGVNNWSGGAAATVAAKAAPVSSGNVGGFRLDQAAMPLIGVHHAGYGF